jgi:hypothetical protein
MSSIFECLLRYKKRRFWGYALMARSDGNSWNHRRYRGSKSETMYLLKDDDDEFASR